MDGNEAHREPSRPVGPAEAIAAAWLLSVGFDLFLHAGILAHLYARPSAFLLPAEDAFRRIPLGYATFLALTVCAVLGAAAAGIRRRRLWVKVGATWLLLVAATVLLQSLGLAPAIKTVGGG